MGLEPTTFRSEGGRAIHYATRPLLDILNRNQVIKCGRENYLCKQSNHSKQKLTRSQKLGLTKNCK